MSKDECSCKSCLIPTRHSLSLQRNNLRSDRCKMSQHKARTTLWNVLKAVLHVSKLQNVKYGRLYDYMHCVQMRKLSQKNAADRMHKRRTQEEHSDLGATHRADTYCVVRNACSAHSCQSEGTGSSWICASAWPLPIPRHFEPSTVTT